MVDFKATDLNTSFLIIKSASKRGLVLKPGEIVKGKIVEVSPLGDVLLKIKGTLVKAKAKLNLEKGLEGLFKVLDTGADNTTLKLQFVEYSGKKVYPDYNNELRGDLEKLVKSLGVVIKKEGISATEVRRIYFDLLKALHSNADTLSDPLRFDLVRLLRSFLKSDGQGVGERLGIFKNRIPAPLKEFIPYGIFIDEVMDGEREEVLGLRKALQNSGVTLEAKLRLFLKQIEKKEKQDIRELESSLLKKDMKLSLLKIKELLEEGAGAREGIRDKGILEQVNTLLKDIETYQILSKVTDSLYTFLPVTWRGFKDVDIMLKKTGIGCKDQLYVCRIQFDTERLGNLTATVLMYRDGFFVVFKTKSPFFLKLLNLYVNELEEAFRNKGLSLKVVRILDADESSSDELDYSLSFKNMVDIKV
ncbi:MAG: hypothetical protein KatS3mg078_0111 [Deltaproteobacteria bacterium]|nr:MAG: hypothetical protein KatS3mg078_0111 [Deltaproteobacteria bacterium]